MRFVLSLAALLLISVPAQAGAIFDFSFQNVNGTVNGTVSGKITLSGTGDGTFSATSIIVNSAPALGYTLPFDVVSDMPLISDNVFVVSGGQIDKNLTKFDGASFSGSRFLLNKTSYGSRLNIEDSFDIFVGVIDTNNSTLSYSTPPAAVPEPSTAFALAAVCGVIGGLRRMRRSA